MFAARESAMKAIEMLYPGMYRGASLERKEKTAMMPPTVGARGSKGTRRKGGELKWMW